MNKKVTFLKFLKILGILSKSPNLIFNVKIWFRFMLVSFFVIFYKIDGLVQPRKSYTYQIIKPKICQNFSY